MKNKEEWIKAFNKTLREYKLGIHKCSTAECPLCSVAHSSCAYCPMNVFESDTYYGCGYRKIPANDSRNLSSNEKKSLIEFYEKAITALKESPMKERSYDHRTNSIWSRKIKEIDKEIYNNLK